MINLAIIGLDFVKEVKKLLHCDFQSMFDHLLLNLFPLKLLAVVAAFGQKLRFVKSKRFATFQEV